jgi:hypothetical protein
LLGRQSIALILLAVLPSHRLVDYSKIIGQLFELAHWNLNERAGRVDVRKFCFVYVTLVQILAVIFDRLQHNTPIVTTYIFKSNEALIALFCMTGVEISERDRRHSIIIQWILVIETDFEPNQLFVIKQAQWEAEAFHEALGSQSNKTLRLIVTSNLVHC